MSKRMLIDASHPEETRVVVLDGQKVEEFDFEAASKRPLKGNIYLAKVTRVEPSLQAAFVEYGGNRQGFLAFSEIHPDYYQIPVADRLALIAEAEAEARRRQDDDVESFEITSGPKSELAEDAEDESVIDEAPDAPRPLEVNGATEASESSADESTDDDEDVFSNGPGRSVASSDERDADDDLGVTAPLDESETPEMTGSLEAEGDEEPRGEHEGAEGDERDNADSMPSLAASEAEGTIEAPSGTLGLHDGPNPAEADATASQQQALQAPRPPQRWMRKRHYKIQEVIKRRQIILVQVVKEERGNKGAALTTYLSLAGRYCVLMPNTPRGGGISRKITNSNDRTRLKAAAQALELPEGMGLIIRTAGENRTKLEIKRDYEYLLRLWDTIRELTLKSNAPACVYEEGDLIKRAIRDLYNKDVGEVLVEGEAGYHNAKEFMRMLMPSHAKNVKLYKEPVPLFHRHHIEAQLDAMFSPTVTLRSGGYIVINQTEALVSIDVNSGRATREHSIEETAHKTNLEAADEIARQLRLRDLAGLIVIDFIDMEDGRNDRDVERRLRDAVKNDRARVQIGKISQFGLLEMSRQRLRAGVIAGSTVPCPHCGGQGIVRSVESTSLRVLRGLEEEGQKLRSSVVTVRVASDVAIYTLNQKRKELARIENDYGMAMTFEPKEGLLAGNFEIERTQQKTAEERARYAVSVEAGFGVPQIEPEEEPEIVEEEIEAEEDIEDEAILAEQGPEDARPQQREDAGRRRRRRRGGRNRHRDRDRFAQAERPREFAGSENGQALPPPVSEIEGAPSFEAEENQDQTHASVHAEGPSPEGQPAEAGESGRRRRRRRRRRGRGGQGAQQFSHPENQDFTQPEQRYVPVDRFGQYDEIDTTPQEEPRRIEPPQEVGEPAMTSPSATPNEASTPVWSLRQDRVEPADVAPTQIPVRSEPLPELTKTREEPQPARDQSPQPARKGWWQRAFKSNG